MPHLRNLFYVTFCVLALAGHARAAETAKPDDADDEKFVYPRRALAAAEVKLDAAEKELNGVSDKLRAKFEQSSEWKDAQAAVAKAQADRDAAAAPVLAKVRTTPEYKAAADEKAKAAAEIDRLRTAGVTGQDAAAASKASAVASAAVQKLEADAIAADPAAKAANAKVLESAAAVAALQKKFNDSIKGSKEFEAATKRRDDARAKRDRAAVAVANMERNHHIKVKKIK